MTRGRLVVLLTSPRVAPGLLTQPAWEALGTAAAVYVADLAHPQVPALRAAGIEPTRLEPPVAPTLIEDAGESDRPVVWLAGTDGDPGLGEQLGMELTRRAEPPELEFLPGSYDLPGARLLDLVDVMNRLRSDCAWVRAQDHRSLVRYLVEEAYETVEAIEAGDVDHLREELGDLLFQVFFHARLATEHPDAGFDIDDVAADLAEKLIRRNPHVFAVDTGPGTAGSGTAGESGESELSVAEIENVWDQLKSEEKGRSSAVEGLPLALPALSLADKVLERLGKSGLTVPISDEDDGFGDALLRMVASARATGIDPEQALRDAVHRHLERVHAVEHRVAE